MVQIVQEQRERPVRAISRGSPLARANVFDLDLEKKKMPTSGKSLPPRKCPVCGQEVWSSKWSLPPNVWQQYKTHLQANHPAYDKWSRNSGFTYLLALVPFFGFALLAAMATSASQASFYAILMIPSSFTVIAMIWVYHRGVKNRFHQAWAQNHGIGAGLKPT